MSMKEEMKEKTKLEFAKLKQMSWKDKIWYIFEYYKIHMLMIFLFGCLIYIIGSSIYRQTFNDVLYCAFINNYGYGDMNSEYFEDGFHEYGNFGKKDLVTIDSSMTLHYGSAAVDENGNPSLSSMTTSESDYASTMKLSAMVAAKSLDVVIIDSVTMEGFSSQGMVANLETILPADVFESLSDRIFYGTNAEGETIPCGVFMGGTDLETIGNIHVQDPVFTVIANTQNPENTVLFLQYLLGEAAN